MNSMQKIAPYSRLWEVIDDKSIIDSNGLNVHSITEAESFLAGYGFDYNLSSERHELASLRKEAIELLEDVLLEEGQKIPSSVINETDIRQLLISASQKDRSDRTKWCCALLRVMHTFAHCGTFFAEYHEGHIHEQILERILPHIHYKDERIFVGDIELVHFESRPVKSRNSIVIKMLHKVENVSTEIFDRFGVRFITRDKLDAIKVIEYLITNNVIMPANIKASKSKNTLLDVDLVKALWSKNGDIEDVRSEIQMLNYPNSDGTFSLNTYSGGEYHAVQFTCRQRVKIRESNGQDIRFYFPYEIQILDEESYVKIQDGMDSHAQYKKRQIATARRRVLPFLTRAPRRWDN